MLNILVSIIVSDAPELLQEVPVYVLPGYKVPITSENLRVVSPSEITPEHLVYVVHTLPQYGEFIHETTRPTHCHSMVSS